MTQLVCDSAYNYRCDQCGGPVTVDYGEYVCTNCGLVQGRVLVPEVKAVERCSPNTCGTTLFPRNKNPKRHQYYKLKKIHKYVSVRVSPSEWEALKILEKVCSRLNIPPQVQQHARCLFMKRTREVCWKQPLMAACLLHVSRETGNPIPLKTILTVFEEYASYKNFSFSKLFFKVWKLFPNSAIKPVEYVPRIVSRVLQSEEAQERLKENHLDPQDYQVQLINRATEMLRGKKCNPHTLAASAVYYASQRLENDLETGKIVSQIMVSEAAGVSEPAIRDNRREFEGGK